MIQPSNRLFSFPSKIRFLLLSLLCLSGLLWKANGWVEAKKNASANNTSNSLSEKKVNYDARPIYFEPNQGQASSETKFLSRGGGYNLLFAAREIAITLRKEIPANPTVEATQKQYSTETIRWQFVGANPHPEIIGEDVLSGYSNYFLGSAPEGWRTNIQHYAKLRYCNVYPGIDLVFYGSQQGQLEYDFVLAPGANPKNIKFAFPSATKVSLSSDGKILLKTAHGTMEQLSPKIYQVIAGERREIVGKYQLLHRHQVGFSLGKYDARHPLVIDPVLVYSTYFGGTNVDQGLGITVDKDGYIYVTGSTASAEFRTVNPLQPAIASTGLLDAFVLKLSPDGTQIIYATYLGTNGADSGNAIAVDSAGNAYVTGQTGPTGFPGTATTPKIGPGGNLETFVCKLNPSGSNIVYATLLGGNNADIANAIAINADGNAFVGGRTDSTNLPATGIQVTKSGSPIFKSTDNAGSWSKTNNGLTAASVQTFAVHPGDANTIYAGTISGLYKSTDSGANWRQPPDAAGKLSLINSLAIDPAVPDTIYVGSISGFHKSTNGGETFQSITVPVPPGFGQSVSAIAIVPNSTSTIYAGTTAGAYKSTNGGTTWSAVSNGLRVSATNNSIPQVSSLVIDPNNTNTIYAGTSSGMYKSIDAGAQWTAINNGLTEFIGSPAALAVSTITMDLGSPNTMYLVTSVGGRIYKTIDGGASWQSYSSGLILSILTTTVTAIAIDPNSSSTIYLGSSQGVFKSVNGGVNWQPVVNGLTNLYVRGLMISRTNPTTIFAGTINGSDAFVAKLNADGIGAQWLTYLGGNEYDEVRGLALDTNGNCYVTGATTSTNFPTTANGFQPVLGGITDAFVTKINPTATSLVYSTYIGGTGGDNGAAITVNQQGEAYVTGAAGTPVFPVLNSIQPFGNGATSVAGSDAYVTRLKADGSGILYSTFLGGFGQDAGLGIALDSGGNVTVTGTTQSANFPVKGAFQSTLAGGTDAFVTKVNATGTVFLYSSYLGGSNNDSGYAIALDKNGNVQVTGTTSSLNFPTVNSLQTAQGNSDIFIVKLAPSPDLAVTMTASTDTINFGENLTYNLQVTNAGEIAATNVTLSNPLPTGASVVSANASQGSCSGTGTINCALGNLAVGASATVIIVIKPPAIQTFTNTVTVTGAEKEATTTNNNASVDTRVVYTDLALTVVHSNLQIEAGKNLTWTVKVRNNGPLMAKSIVITDNLPAEVEFTSCKALGKGVCTRTGNNIQMTVADLAWGATESFVLAGKVKTEVTEGTIINRQISVVGSPPDSVPNNNQDISLIKVIKPDSLPVRNGKLLYASNKTGASNIAIINPDGSGRYLFPYGVTVWSPDGLSLAGVYSANELMVVNADGTGLRKIPVSTPYPSSPTWTPDGARLVFFGPNGLFIINADGTNERQLADQQIVLLLARRVRLSPDGSRLLFGNSSYQNGGISTMLLDGVSIEGLTRPADNSRMTDENAAWSPDSSLIVFSRKQNSANGSIFVMKADGTDVRQLTTGMEQDDYPVFSPDGKQIAFARRDGLWMMNTDGTNQRRIVREEGQYALGVFDWQRIPATPQPQTFVISGRVTNQGPRFVYPKIELTGTVTATTTIESDGVYSFGNLPAGGNYTVTASDPSFLFNPPTRTFTNLQSYQETADFTATFNGRTIIGRIVDDAGIGIEGVRVWLYGTFGQQLNAVTDAKGDYSFTDLLSGLDYTVQPLGFGSNDLYTPAKTSFTSLSESKVANFVGKREKLDLTATVIDQSGAAVSGVTVTINGLKGTVSSVRADTDNNGKVTFNAVESGYSYTVTASKVGHKIVPSVRHIVANKHWELDFYSGASATATVSAASYKAEPITPDGIVSLFGEGLARAPKAPEGGLVYNLDGVTVTIETSDGLASTCPLFFVSPTQINFLVPWNAASGEAMIRVYRDNKVVGIGAVQIASVSPGLFSMSQNGSGIVASALIRVRGGKIQPYEYPYTFDAANNRYNPVPIDLGPELGNDSDQVFLELYGTGIRRRSALEKVTAKIGGVATEVLYAGSQNFFAGLDQVNIKVPRSLIGRGEVQIELMVDGKPTNPVTVHIK